MPVNREESGGVRGLRAWAFDAGERVKRQLPGMGGGALPPGAQGAVVAELEQLAGLLDHDDSLRGAVTVWLAGALALRHADGDAGRAEGLLREVRDRATPLGAVLGEEDRRWAALFLMGLLSPVQPQPGACGSAPDLSGCLERISRAGPAAMIATATEIGALMTEVVELPLPSETIGSLRQAQALFTSPSAQGLSDLVKGMMPPGAEGSPFEAQVQRMMERMLSAMAAGGRSPGASAQDQDQDQDQDQGPGQDQGPAASAQPPPRSRPEPRAPAQPQPGVRPDPEPGPGRPRLPGFPFTPEEFRNSVAVLDAVHGVTGGLDPVLRSGKAAELNALLARLRSAQDLAVPGTWDTAPGLESIRALLLGLSPAVGGTHQDQSTGRAHLDKVVRHLEGLGESLPPEMGDPAVLAAAIRIGSGAREAGETGDGSALGGLLKEAEALAAAVPEDDPLRFAVDGALGGVLGALGVVTHDRETLLRALPHIERGTVRLQESAAPFAGAVPVPSVGSIEMLRAALSGDKDVPVPDLPPPAPDASMEERYSYALSLGMRFDHTGDPVVLDACIEEFERLRAGIRDGMGPRFAADALWHLTEMYHLRRLRTSDVPDRAAETRTVEAAEEALASLAADVLLQTGAEHGLLAARTGARRGVRAARMAASYGMLHEAVAALEVGRALVLQAASTSSAVPDLLEAAGRHDLAEAWRTAGRSSGADDGAEVPGLLSSTLRREALDVLGHRRGVLLNTPTVSELADGLAEAGADVLLYLVAGDREGPGLVILVGPEAGVGAGALHDLLDVEEGPLSRYVEAAAARDRSRTGAAAQAWEAALEELCDWAAQELGPVLNGVEERLARTGAGRKGRPLRVVLVPCGRLGIVPWHAARLPAEAAHDRLCQAAVVSYAASAGQFLRAARRARRHPAAVPVLLADPSMTLSYADTEVTALRDAFYLDARLCGALYDEKVPPGTPDAVLGFLGDGISLLHIVSHGEAGTRPTVSALHLVAEDRCTPAPLTVARLLDHEKRQDHTDGPLVVLSACQTDLSARDHDEALTLTTAFLAAGARDVVGSRWLAQDSASALLMAVFHHYLTVDGLSPVDALRAAQLWMLDPLRENPGSLQGDLLREMEQPGLERTAFWAAFTHQGHPGPDTANRGEGIV
ncbi:CHAT domain-containing protein [Streptomyces sp. NBC_00101]|uniref:CHAT domain-containing protein n=1 Tax=Streptomyces sp. NBC_00101 TaxID=2975651 RepID=UPI003253E27B